MHESVATYVARQVAHHELAALDTLEVGSYDVNGSVRSLFNGLYVGLDRNDGPGVDIVGLADALPFDDASFDVVVTTEMLEHDTRPWRSIADMARVLVAGGYLILTARGFNETGAFAFHNPPDLWRYSLDAIRIMVDDAGLTVLDCSADPQCPGVFVTAEQQ